MALVFPQLRAVIAGATGIKRVYCAGETGQYALPDAINETPAALIYPANLVDHQQIPSAVQKHRYTVHLQILGGSGADIESRSITALPFIDNVLAALAAHVQLNGTCTSCRLLSWRFGTLVYGWTEFLGYDCEIEVEENLTTSFVG